MKLLLDLGNSRLKWAVVEPEVTGSAFSRQGALSQLEELPAQLEAAGIALDRTESVWLACVARPERLQLVKSILEAAAVPVREAHTGMGVSLLRHSYSSPGQLGVDRWLAMLAARREMAGAVGVIDAGSAITVDLVDADSRHGGGLIMPGLRLLEESLRQGTALSWQSTPAKLALATDTAGAISNGVLCAAQGAVRNAAQLLQMNAKEGSQIGWLLTGGDAGLLASACPPGTRRIDDLVLRGLRIVSELDAD